MTARGKALTPRRLHRRKQHYTPRQRKWQKRWRGRGRREKKRAQTHPAQIASAQAALHSAQENLAKVMAGPSAQEKASAQASLVAAQAAYNDLQKGPTDAQLTQLQTDMRKAQVAVDTAQTAYDKIAWQ